MEKHQVDNKNLIYKYNEYQIKNTISKVIKNSKNILNLDLNPMEYDILTIILFTNNQSILFNSLTIFKSNIKKIKEKILSTPKNELKYKSYSCIFGGFLGDSMGSYCEFKNPNPNNSNLIFKGKNIFGKPPGQITDDSEMAISMSYSIMDNLNIFSFNSDLAFYYYGTWYCSIPFDIGNTTIAALSNFNYNKFKIGDKILNKIKIPEKNFQSQANGFLMRLSPFIVWFYYINEKYIYHILNSNNIEKYYELFNKIKEEGMKDNICTHPCEINASITAFYVFIGLLSIFENKCYNIIEKLNLLLKCDFDNLNDSEIKKLTLEKISIFQKKNFNKYEYFKSVMNQIGSYIHGYELTLFYLLYLDEYVNDNKFTKFRKIMNEICNYGGDTDTNCCIVGTIIGPIIGLDNFGEELNILLDLIPSDRIQYTNGLMFLFIDFLEKGKRNNKFESNNKYFTEDYINQNNNVRYYTIKSILNCLFNDLIL